MNFQQLEYIDALDRERHFIRAAEQCHVTQATLSMMIRKLEDELGVVLFDRSKQPVIPTEIGVRIIRQARVVLREQEKMRTLIAESQAELTGELRLGIIPTLAPYLLPLFIDSFLKKYPRVHLSVSEFTTEEIIHRLENQDIDAGLLATPLDRPGLFEDALFYEEFVVYAAAAEKLAKKYILPKDIDVNRLWLLEEGHCLRSQIINLCALKKQEREAHQLDFTTGSLETLKRIVEAKQGITILPALAMDDMSPKQKRNVRFFKPPAPVREIGLVTYRQQLKAKLIKALKEEILLHIPEEMKLARRKKVLEVF